MKLLSDAGINYENPQDISFAFGGFAPLTCRLVQEAIRHNWRALGKAFKHIPGETVIPTSVSVPSSARPVVLVYFVGGVTYSEV
jgi:vacuolar protein sorting-associated protein 33A